VRKTGSGSKVEDVDRQYESCTLMAIHSSIHRYLSLKAYGSNIKEDECFRHSRDVLSAKMKQLKSMGKGNKPNASLPFTENDIEIFCEKQLLGKSKYKLIIGLVDTISVKHKNNNKIHLERIAYICIDTI